MSGPGPTRHDHVRAVHAQAFTGNRVVWVAQPGLSADCGFFYFSFREIEITGNERAVRNPSTPQ